MARNSYILHWTLTKYLERTSHTTVWQNLLASFRKIKMLQNRLPVNWCWWLEYRVIELLEQFLLINFQFNYQKENLMQKGISTCCKKIIQSLLNKEGLPILLSTRWSSILLESSNSTVFRSAISICLDQRASVKWPSRSLDLSSIDFYFLRHLKAMMH